MSRASPLHVVITTHTTRHLRRTLLGVRHQTRRADTVTVTCDVDDPAIAELVDDAARQLDLPITLVLREHQGTGRSAQVRNNGVRALLQRGVEPTGGLVFFDGDCCPAPDVLALHEADLQRRELVIGYRIDLTPEQTEQFDEDAVRAGRAAIQPTREQYQRLARRHRRYVRHWALRRLGLSKSHKPKVLGANHAVRFEMFVTVNGNDEQYQHWGVEDDDLGRRFYLAGGRPAVAVRYNIVYHQHHPSRRRPAWRENPSAQRLMAGGPMRCEYGLDTPYPQSEPRVLHFASGRAGVS